MRSRAVVVATALAVSMGLAAPAQADDPLPAVVAGTVTVAGVPLDQGTVVLRQGESVTITQTDAEGHYEVPVPPGSYLICAGKADGSVHHSCTPDDPLGVAPKTWTVTAPEVEDEEPELTLNYALAPGAQPLTSRPTPITARWQRKKKGYRLLHTAGPLVFRPANNVAVLDVEVAVVRTFDGAASPFTVDIQRVPGFVKAPDQWGAVLPLPAVFSGPELLDEVVCGVPVDQGAGRPPRLHAVPTVVQQVRSGKGAVLYSRTAAVDESACRRDRLSLDTRGVLSGKRRAIRISAHTDSAVQVYRPKARIYRNGKLVATRRIRVDGGAKAILLPKKFRKRSTRIKVVLPATNGSPRFAETRTVRFPKR